MDHANQAEGEAPVKLVTVHGTKAGDLKSTNGARWWQLGSKFQKDLKARLNVDRPRCEVVPYRWDIGPNSEDQRRQAGAGLLDLLDEYEEAGIDYYLIGHSHGGSVIYHALLKSVHRGRQLTRLRQWCTVGTPFLDYRANRFMFQRLAGVGLTAYSMGVFACILALVYWLVGRHNSFDFVARAEKMGMDPQVIAKIATWDGDALMHNFALALTIFGISCFALLFVMERRKKGWTGVREKQQVEAWYGATWCGLWHRDDEAISALMNVQHLDVDLVPVSFLKPVAGFLQLFLVWGTGLLLCLDVVLFGGQRFGALALWFGAPSPIIDEQTGAVLRIDESGLIFGISMSHWTGIIEAMLITLAVLAVVVWLLTKLVRKLAEKVGSPLAALLNGILWRLVRHTAWGDDLLAEDVHFVGPSPPVFERAFEPLPPIVATPLSKHSDANALRTLGKVRRLLGMTEGARAQLDARVGLDDTLNWQELIHTSYFEVPAFVDLIALSLAQAGLGTLRDGFASDEEGQDALRRWLRHAT